MKEAYHRIPQDSMEKARSLVRKADGQPTVVERLAYLEGAKAHIAAMKAPGEERDFNYQRCDPHRDQQPYEVVIKTDLKDPGTRERVREALNRGEEIPSTGYMIAVTWYYALFLKRGSKYDEDWRKPTGFVYAGPGGACLGLCPPGVVEVAPMFGMNLNTLNLLMNIRDHAQNIQDEGTRFNFLNRSLTTCAKDVPRTKQTSKRKRAHEEEGGADRGVEEAGTLRRSGRVGRQRTLLMPEPMTLTKMGGSTKGRRKKRGAQLPVHMRRMLDLGMVCWEKYGQGKDYKRVKEFQFVFQKVQTLPAQSDHRDGGEGETSSSSGDSGIHRDGDEGETSSSSGGDGGDSDGGGRGVGHDRGDGGTPSPSSPAPHACTGGHGVGGQWQGIATAINDAVWKILSDDSKSDVSRPVLMLLLDLIAEGRVQLKDISPLLEVHGR